MPLKSFILEGYVGKAMWILTNTQWRIQYFQMGGGGAKDYVHAQREVPFVQGSVARVGIIMLFGIILTALASKLC